MEFYVDEVDIGRLILGYLRERGAYETLAAFQLEANLSEGRLGEELLYVQRLVLQGRWEEVNDFLKPIKEKHSLTNTVDFIILKQKYLESLSYQGGGGQRIAFPPWRPSSTSNTAENRDLIEKESIFSQLIALQGLCSSEEFNSLCLCLTLEKLEDHPQYQDWTVSKGRVDTFRLLRNMLLSIFPGTNDPDHSDTNNSSEHYNSSNNGLLKTVAMGVAYHCRQDAPSNKTYYHTQLGQIVPVNFNQHTHVTSPSVILSSHIRYLKRFDMVLEKPVATLTQHEPRSRPSTGITQPHVVPAAAVSRSSKTTFITEPPLQINTNNNVFNFSGGVTSKWPTANTPQEAPVTDTAPQRFEEPPPSSQSVKAPVVFWLAGDNEPPPLPSEVDANSNNNKPSGLLVVAEEPASRPMPAALRKKMQALENKSASNDAYDDEPVRHPHQSQSEKIPTSHHAALPQLPVTRPVSRGRGSEESSHKYAYQQPPVQQQQHQEPAQAKPRPVSMKSSSSVHSGSTASKGTAASAPQSKLPQPPARKADHEPTGFPSIKESVNSNNKAPSVAAPKTYSDGSVVSAKSQQSNSQGPSPKPPLQPSKYLIYQTEGEAPVRCISILEQPSSSSAVDRSMVHLALGTNDKHVHFLKYGKQDIAHEFQGVPPSTLCDARAFLSSTGGLPLIHNGSVYALDVHKDYRLVASGSNDKLLKISSVDRCEVLKILKGHTGTIRVTRFQPIYEPKAATALVVSAGAGDNCPRLWDINKGACIQVCTAHPSAIHGLAWISLSSFVTGCEGGVIMHHDINSPQAKLAYNLSNKVRQRESDLGLPDSVSGVKRGICCLALLNGDGALQPTDTTAATPMIAGCESGFLTIFDAFTGRILCNSKIHNEDIRSISVKFQSMTLLTTSYDGTAALWNIQYNQRECVFELIPLVKLLGGHGNSKILSAAMIPHSRDVVTSASDGSVMLWSL